MLLARLGHDVVVVDQASFPSDTLSTHSIAAQRRRPAPALGAALESYEQLRDRALRETFEITCSLAAYPPVPTFIELQKQLAAAIDKEAAALAARPIPGERLAATA